MKLEQSNLRMNTKRRRDNMIAYTIICVAVFAFVIIVIDTLVQKFA
jgi:hypothetical protein